MLYKIKTNGYTIKLYATPNDYLIDMQMYHEIVNFSYLKSNNNDIDSCDCYYLKIEENNNLAIILDSIETNWAAESNFFKDNLKKILINNKIGWVNEKLLEKL